MKLANLFEEKANWPETPTLGPNLTLFILEYMRCLTTWLVFHQVERRFHGQVSNHQPLRSVWVSLHYHPVV